MPVTSSISAIAICLDPDSEGYWTLFQRLAEAWALHSLNKLIVERLGEKASTISKLRARDPDDWLRVPPLCCCYCLPDFAFDDRILKLVLLLTRQFMIIVPVASVIGIVIAYNASLTRSSTPWQLLRLLLLASSLLALYGLVIIWKATLPLAKHAHISLKFLAIKIVIILGIVQEYVFSQLNASDALHADGKYSEEDLEVPNTAIYGVAVFDDIDLIRISLK